jgi:NAD(P)H-nitrite reductase large subunit
MAAAPVALASHDRWRVAMSALSEPPNDWAAQAPDELVVCRCEQVTAGELRACVAATGAREMNRLKALSRVGMGRCQGRMCGQAAARLLAHAAGCELSAVGRLRAQPPVKPVPVSALASAIDHAPPAPPEESDD